ncbi:hypothetical protein G6F46_015166 [Rhizopus delemar]|nr:hypothetical protein G6F46_015166 [Rhizopus delemar]
MIDYFLTNTTSALRSPRMQVYSDLSLGSDHKLLSLSFDYAVPDGYPSQPVLSSSSARRLWNLSRLKEPDVCSLYVASFQSLAAPLVDQFKALKSSPPSAAPPIDALNDSLNEAIYEKYF